MPRVVALPRAEEVDGGQVCAGGLKRGGQHGVVRDVHVQDDRDRARGSANMRQNRAASSGSSSPSPCPAAVLRLILRRRLAVLRRRRHLCSVHKDQNRTKKN